MTHRQKSYAKVGDIARAEPEFQEGEQHDARRFGDLTEECRDAETVLPLGLRPDRTAGRLDDLQAG